MSFQLKEITSEKLWNSFVLQHSPQSLFQSWDWGEVEHKSGSNAMRYGFYHNDELMGMALVLVVRAKRGTYLHVRQGPVLTNYSQSTLESVLKVLLPVAKKERALFIRMSPMVIDSSELEIVVKKAGLLRSPIHEVDAERCWVLSILRPDDEILQGMRKTTRYEIRRGLKMDIQIKRSTESKDLKLFTDLYHETSKRHGFVSHGSILEEFEQFTSTGSALLLNGFFEKKLIASALIVFYGGQAIYHHGASVPSKAPVSYLLQWYAILEAKKRNLKLYNFYGIAPDDKPNHPWRGLTLFKKGFGGEEVRYLHSHDYPVSPLYIFPRVIESLRTRLRGY